MSTLTAYRVPPQMEFKAEREVQDAGIPCTLPRETVTVRAHGRKKPSVRTVPLMRGYLAAAARPGGSKYVRSAVGPVREVEIIRMVTTMDRIQRRSDGHAAVPFRIGAAVFLGETPSFVAGVDGESVAVAYSMCGKQHVQTVHYSRLRPG